MFLFYPFPFVDSLGHVFSVAWGRKIGYALAFLALFCLFPPGITAVYSAGPEDTEEVQDMSQQFMMQLMQVMQRAMQDMDRDIEDRDRKAFLDNPVDAHANQDTDRIFFLDRSFELELNPDQMARLMSMRSELQRDSIRLDADYRIAELELSELLDREWSLEEAEKQIRNVQKIQGDIQIRYLKAVRDARGVLTASQLEKVVSKNLL